MRVLRQKFILGMIACVILVGSVVAYEAFRHAYLTDPEPSLLLLDRVGRFLTEVHPEAGNDLGYWPIGVLPEKMAATTIAIEDQRFFEHNGVDLWAILRALWQNVSHGKRISGASTIAMQVSRMQRPCARTYVSKLREALIARFLIYRYGHKQVLLHYLRIAPYGNRIFGAAYAARRYFGKPIEDLSWAESAFLAAIPQSPGKMNPFTPQGRRKAITRGQRILYKLLSQQKLSQADFDLATTELAHLSISLDGKRPPYAMHAILYLESKLRDVQRQKIDVILHTTLDLDLQESITTEARRALRTWENHGAGNVAIIVLSQGTNEILAWVGSTDYFDDAHSGAIDYARIKRSPGSALKPFIYALALDRGLMTPATILDDTHRWNGISDADNAYLGPLLPRMALANSRNVPAARLLDTVGLKEGFSFLQTLGLHDGTLPAEHYGLGLVIGTLPVSLEEIVSAYSVLLNEGWQKDLVSFREQPKTNEKKLISTDTARQITHFLSDPIARLPSFPRMGALEYPFPVAVKTGTSSQCRDAWCLAYSKRYLVGVWVGHPDWRPMQQMTGFHSAARLARQVLIHLHPEEKSGLADLSFPLPERFQLQKICMLSGKRATTLCPNVIEEGFRPGEEPIHSCNAHTPLAIHTQTNWPVGTGSNDHPVSFKTLPNLDLHDAYLASSLGSPTQNAVSNALLPEANSIKIILPQDGIELLRDPATPPEQATLALEAVVSPPVKQIVWYVDGAPFKTVDYPYSSRWPLKSGKHTFEARLPFQNRGASNPVHVRVW